MRLNVCLFVCLVLITSRAEAMVVVSEILSDPPAGLAGDANNDGTRSTTTDEFVEIFNAGNESINLSGWSIHDLTDVRHVFPGNTILDSFNYLVVFGGGSPNLPGIFWQKASTGSLSLNNTNETVSLLQSDGTLADDVSYGTLANQDQSIVRLTEGSGEFVLHSSISSKLFSPGASSNPVVQTAAVPEPASLISFLLGFNLLGLCRRLKA